MGKTLIQTAKKPGFNMEKVLPRNLSLMVNKLLSKEEEKDYDGYAYGYEYKSIPDLVERVRNPSPKFAMLSSTGFEPKDFPELKNDLILRVARGEDSERVPIWCHRQAGRFLPEF